MEGISTIADEFTAFAQCTLTDDAPDAMREYAKGAFYAGAGIVLDAVETIDRTAESPAQRAEALAPLREDYASFVRERLVRHIARMMGLDHMVTVEMHIERRPAPDAND
ncbi:hypothetical protein WK39_27785 [Burkholderia cepacia]|uniref:hypothetical protein n=1 Tax=Burkholderia cepacia complex TaxID=87882 RepID=UPI00075B9012|nr:MULTISPECIES: hypothetical protein [Burkholderia cepacia complex]KVS50667.1 hypothetical protein WK39_27785 [Burkholderia cepacia]KVS65693.1 hypothetical protein WK40_12095 [Burkholderia cepacia]KWO64054.1 hypothetical protein WT98_27830 [Burkholderia territorii]